MKQIGVLLALFAFLAVDTYAMSLEEFKNHLERYRGNTSLAGEGGLPHKTPQDIAFILYVAEDWQRALTLVGMEGLDRW
jgi:hypothetical protein